MRNTTRTRASWHWYAALGALLPACLANASPAVNVALQASFDSSPYLVELLYVDTVLAYMRTFGGNQASNIHIDT
jgi:hypothetical protein